MKPINAFTRIAAAAALALAGAHASAQATSEQPSSPGRSMSAPSPASPSPANDAEGKPTSQPPTAEVDISAVKLGVAAHLGVDESKVPDTVTVPADVAARACGVPADQLSTATSSAGMACKAQNSSLELQAAVQDELGGTPSTAVPTTRESSQATPTQ